MKRLFTILNIAAAFTILALLVVAAIYLEQNSRNKGQVFSERILWHDLWATYKLHNIELATGRTLDWQQGGITTSEGQGYTMLRAVWSDDRQMFEQSWQWTKDNLGRPSDKLLAWKFGKLPEGGYGQLSSEGGNNSASDANTDIALALIFAYARWGEPLYLYDAKPLLEAVWEHQVIEVNGRYLLVASELEKSLQKNLVVVNPSYFSPYAYRVFAKVDSTHPWNKLADDSYYWLEQSMLDPLDKQSSVGLPPDWMLVNTNSGLVSADPERSTDYGYEAMRIPWKLSLSYLWFSDLKALDLLRRMDFLESEWARQKKIYARYTHDGKPVVDYESLASYGSFMGYLVATGSIYREEFYSSKLLPLYSQDNRAWAQPMSYYDDNWVVFGTGAQIDTLVNYANDPLLKF